MIQPKACECDKGGNGIPVKSSWGFLLADQKKCGLIYCNIEKYVLFDRLFHWTCSVPTQENTKKRPGQISAGHSSANANENCLLNE